MSDAYLFDTNIISALTDVSHINHPPVSHRFREIKSDLVMLPAMAIAEIQAGLERAPNVKPEKRAPIDSFIARFYPVPFDESCTMPYAVVRAELWRSYSTLRPGSKRQKAKERCPEELLDSVTGKELGIEEPDLIIASIALAQNLILVTNDDGIGMARVRDAAMQAFQRGRFQCQLRTETWR